MSAELLKKLQTRLNIAKQDLVAEKQSLRLTNQKVAQMQRQVEELEQQVKAVPMNVGVVVSEHALLRYLERVKKIDMAALVDEILDEKSKSLIDFAKGNCTVKRSDCHLVVKNNVVVTVNEA